MLMALTAPDKDDHTTCKGQDFVVPYKLYSLAS